MALPWLATPSISARGGARPVLTVGTDRGQRSRHYAIVQHHSLSTGGCAVIRSYPGLLLQGSTRHCQVAASATQPAEVNTEALKYMKEYDPKAIIEFYITAPALLAARAVLLASSLAKVVSFVLQRNYDGLVLAIGELGPTYVKFGQALASRSDIVGEEMASALSDLQDDLPPFPDEEALRIVRAEVPHVADYVQGPPRASASLCQVYKADIEGEQVAIKVQRPGIRGQVAADAMLLRFAAGLLQLSGIVKAQAVAAVDEFATRLFEEMDFENEANNLRKFRALYGEGGLAAAALPPPGVRVPAVVRGMVSPRVIVMEWLDGTKLTEGSIVPREDLPLVELGIKCTLSQLLETGVMHADPHGGNLLKLRDGQGLAYLDFGLVSEVPQRVRDGIVAAVVLLVFTRDYPAVARLFGELMLIPPEVARDAAGMSLLAKELSIVANATLVFPEDGGRIPEVRFDQLLGALSGLVPRFKFILPPYFINNARALGTLEGMARSADPNFNIIRSVYPFAIQRLLANPDRSPVLRKVVRKLTCDSNDGHVSMARLEELLDDAAVMSGLPKRKIASDALRSPEGRRLAAEAVFMILWRRMKAVFGAAWKFVWPASATSPPIRPWPPVATP